MKTKFSYLPVIALLFLSLFISSCSKDKKIEKALHKKEGEWNITSVTWEKVVQDTSGQSINFGTTSNAGTFTFDKDGDGNYQYTINGTSRFLSFRWNVHDEKISVTKLSNTFDLNGDFTQTVISMMGSQTSKNTIVLEGSETIQYSFGTVSQEVLVATFSLTKK